MNSSKRELVFGACRLDLDGQVLFRSDEEVKLSRPAFAALVFLVENNGRALSKAEIMNYVWAGRQVEPNNLDQAISLLRKVLCECASEGEKYIKTIRGYGYRFVAEVQETRPSSGPRVVTLQDATNTVGPPISARAQTPPAREPFVVIWTILTAVGVTIGIFMFRSVQLRSLGPDRPSVTVNPDGSWTANVPVLEEGVKLETHGHAFSVQEGETIAVSTTGQVNIGRGPVGADGESGYSDQTMDGPFKDRVGGLEMWIGADKEANRYFIGSGRVITVQRSGILTFRVIESRRGYHDGDDSGVFTVTVVRK